jgi:hypothetical protein
VAKNIFSLSGCCENCFYGLITCFHEVSDDSSDSLLRSRAMMISGRLLSKEVTYSSIDEPCKTCTFVHWVLLFTNICWQIHKFDFIIFELITHVLCGCV